VKSPFKRGFGTYLIEQTAKSEGGDSHVYAEADGIRWEITLPLKTDRVGVPQRKPEKPASPGVRSVSRPPQAGPLRGKRFLIVEDEPMIALDIVAGLENEGVIVEGPVSSVKDALRVVEEGAFDGVLLDANLRGQPVGDVAAALTRRNIPFVFVTGYGRQALPESFARSKVLTKPFTQEQLIQTASQVVGSERMGLRLQTDQRS
jgi:CheY-like chemotaxis protein